MLKSLLEPAIDIARAAISLVSKSEMVLFKDFESRSERPRTSFFISSSAIPELRHILQCFPYNQQSEYSCRLYILLQRHTPVLCL